jgi:hypothetical protein
VKHVLFALLSVTFVVIGILMVRDNQGWIAYAGIVAGGLFAVIFGVQALPGAVCLEVGPAGIRFCSLYRWHELAWRDVERFYVVRLSGNRFIWWSYVADHPKQGRITKALGGAVGMLPDNFRLKPQQLADKLNARLASYRAESTRD